MTASPCASCTGCHRPTASAVAANQPVGRDFIYGGSFVKAWTVPDAGTLLPQHSHPFPHMTFVSSGGVRVWREGEDLGEFHAPAAVEIPAFALHEFVTLEPGTLLLCIHQTAHTAPDGTLPIHQENQLRTSEG